VKKARKINEERRRKKQLNNLFRIGIIVAICRTEDLLIRLRVYLFWKGERVHTTLSGDIF
jgi:hypothetical protein